MLDTFVVYAQPLQDWSSVPGCMVDGVPTLKCAEVLMNNVVLMASAFVLLLLLVMFVWGSFSYLTSLGNPDKVKKAQGIFKFAVLGLILYLSSFLILKTIDMVFLGNCGRIFKFQINDDLGTPLPNCP